MSTILINVHTTDEVVILLKVIIFLVTGHGQRVALSTKKKTLLAGSISSIPPRCSHDKCNVVHSKMSRASQTLIKDKKTT